MTCFSVKLHSRGACLRGRLLFQLSRRMFRVREDALTSRGAVGLDVGAASSAGNEQPQQTARPINLLLRLRRCRLYGSPGRSKLLQERRRSRFRETSLSCPPSGPPTSGRCDATTTTTSKGWSSKHCHSSFLRAGIRATIHKNIFRNLVVREQQACASLNLGAARVARTRIWQIHAIKKHAVKAKEK